ncbi:MAG: translation initiation factor IF-2 [Pseudomonadota bacterium]
MSETNSGDGKGGRGGRGPGGGAGGGRGPVRQNLGRGRSTSVVVEKKRTKRIVQPGSTGAAGSGGASSASAGSGAASPQGDGEQRRVTLKPRSEAGGAARGAAPAAGGGRGAAASGGPRAERSGAGGGTGGGERQGQRAGRGKMLNSLSEEEYSRRLEAIKQAKRDEEIRRRAEEEAAKKRAALEAAHKAEEEARAKEEAERRAAEEAERAKAEAEAAAEKAAADAKAAEQASAAEVTARSPEEERQHRAEEEARKRIAAAEARKAEILAKNPAAAETVERAREAEREGARPRPAASAPAGGAPAGPGPGRMPEREDDGGRRGAAKRPTPTRGRGDEKRRTGKLTISKLSEDGEGGRQRSLASMRRRQERARGKGGRGGEPREKVIRDVKIPEAITVQELANRMAERVADVIKALMKNGMMATQNQSIDQDTAELLVEEFGHRVTRVSESDVEEVINVAEDAEENLEARAPIVTIMGHVDHGKTSLLDALRKTNVVAGEAGGITQHIGAYQITTDSGAPITFLDTPGHAAFTSMRARGANVTDVVILVVAADDSVMPQTVEAISHAKAAKVPMIVAINKIDRPAADANKVRTELLQHEVIVEEMSGDVLDVEVSAITGQGLDTLVENIALQAELLELKANPKRAAEGAVIEAKLDVGRGPVATVLVQRGTLRNGDIFVVGEQWGRVRALINDQGERVKEAGPSVPVEVLGLQGTPEAGDTLNVVEDEAKAREIADYRQRKAREAQAAKGARTTLDQLLAQAKADEDVKELPILVKADVQGSTEAIVQALEKVGNEEVRVRVLHSGVGAITESDVTLAEASKAPIIGFNVRANAPAREAANQKGVEIRYYSIIYDLVDDIKQAASGLLSPEVRETYLGYAAIKQVFKVSGVGKVAGCEVTDGLARRSAGVRLLRDNVVIHEGKLKTLKRFKDEVQEVRAGQECGMAFENYEDIREGDVIEIFETQELERTL